MRCRRSRFKAAINEAMRTLADANKYLSDQAPWKLRESDPERMRTILHVALQLVDDAQDAAHPVPAALVAEGLRDARRHRRLVGHAEDRRGHRGRRPSYPVITGDYDGAARWESAPIKPGTALQPPTPLFTKLDPAVADEELARLEKA